MKEGLKNDMRHIHDLLKQRNKWYIDPYAPDIPELQDICEKAKENADAALSELSLNALYLKYRKWKSSDPIIRDKDRYFEVFLSQVCFDLGLDSLDKEEKVFFEDSCFLSIHFI